MIKLKIRKIGKLKSILEKFPKALARNFFKTVLGILLLSFAFGAIVFYFYAFNAEKKEIEVSENLLEFDSDSFEGVLSEWEKRNEEVSSSGFGDYPNPF